MTVHDILSVEGPLLVEFTAEWCGPCRALAPVLESVVKETNIPLVEVDTDRHPEAARRFAVLSMPTVLLLVDGTEKARSVGAKPKGRLMRDLGLPGAGPRRDVIARGVAEAGP